MIEIQHRVDEEALSSLDLQQRKMLSCQTRVQSDAAFYFDFDSSLLRTLLRVCNSQRVGDGWTHAERTGGETALFMTDIDVPPGQHH